MPRETDRLGIVYPELADAPDVVGDLKRILEHIEDHPETFTRTLFHQSHLGMPMEGDVTPATNWVPAWVMGTHLGWFTEFPPQSSGFIFLPFPRVRANSTPKPCAENVNNMVRVLSAGMYQVTTQFHLHLPASNDGSAPIVPFQFNVGIMRCPQGLDTKAIGNWERLHLCGVIKGEWMYPSALSVRSSIDVALNEGDRVSVAWGSTPAYPHIGIASYKGIIIGSGSLLLQTWGKTIPGYQE